ncbi:MAG TPA: hypothetical protein VFI57_11875 [Pyrinomonadaceae bacterium]|nr:hypothetical protein [Pyrinomonadaceae bacterium]
MAHSMTKTILASVACAVLLCSSLLFAQSNTKEKTEKPWTEWTQKEAEKILSSSPWAQAQVDTDTSEMFFSPTNDPRVRGRTTSNDGQRLESGARNQPVDVKFVVRFFSARPVRQALVRLLELKQKPEPDVAERMHAFANVKSGESIILTLSVETIDQRYAGVVMQAMGSAITATLKNETYLERDGKRHFLHEYVPPGADGFGARFIFLRNIDEQPFIDGNSGEVRFFTKYPNGLKIDRRFKVSDMLYEGQLEY